MPTYASNASFTPASDVNVSGTWNFVNTPTFGSGATGAIVTTTGTQTLSSKTLTSPTMTSPSITGATITGTVTVATGASLVNPSITGATLTGAFTGAHTVASGASITTPTILFTSANVTATGSTGSDAAGLSAITPVIVTATGVSGAGVNLPTGAAVVGACYIIHNKMTGVLKIYSTGATINGTTGTTAFSLTATGNLQATAICTVAGAWSIAGNT